MKAKNAAALTALLVCLPVAGLAQTEASSPPAPGTPVPAPSTDAIPPAPSDPALVPVPPESDQPSTGLLDKGRDGVSSAWSEAIRPTFDRVVGAIPTFLTAVAFLLAAWVVGSLLGFLVRKALSLTDVDDSIARQLGIDHLLERPGKKPISLEHLVAGGVKGVVILIGIVAFFETLDLEMVARPLQGILNKIGSAIPQILLAFLIIILYLAAAAAARLGLTKLLESLDFDARAKSVLPAREIRGEVLGPSAIAGRVLFYVILLFGVPPFLGALGQDALVAPLTKMFEKVLSFAPQVAAAVLLVLIAKVVATIIRELVTNLAAAAGADEIPKRWQVHRVLGQRRVSTVAGTVAYVVVIVPLLVQAVDTLQIAAVSEPVNLVMVRTISFVPHLLGALIVTSIGYVVARVLENLLVSLLSSVGFDALPAKFGFSWSSGARSATRDLKRETGPNGDDPSRSADDLDGSAEANADTPSRLAGSILVGIIMLLTIEQALAVAKLTTLAEMLGRLVAYLPNLTIGVAIMLVSVRLAGIVSDLLARVALEQATDLVCAVGRASVLFLGFSMGLHQLGVAEHVITAAVTCTLGGAALALGIALGLGGRDRAKLYIESRLPEPPGRDA